jgi:hypothetical protein
MFVMIYANMQDTKKPRVQELINQRFTFYELYPPNVLMQDFPVVVD